MCLGIQGRSKELSMVPLYYRVPRNYSYFLLDVLRLVSLLEKNKKQEPSCYILKGFPKE